MATNKPRAGSTLGWTMTRILFSLAFATASLASKAQAATKSFEATGENGGTVSVDVTVDETDGASPTETPPSNLPSASEANPATGVLLVPAPAEPVVEAPRFAFFASVGAQGDFPQPSSETSLTNIKAGFEYRLPSPYFLLRADISANPHVVWLDPVSLKLSPFPSWWVRPYVSVGPTVAFLNSVSPGLVVASGLDITLWRHLFLETEIEGRVISGMTQVAGTAGFGYAF
jgi:hypothetical protein